MTENSQRTEVSERIARSLSVRIFGFDFGKCRTETRENGGTITVKVIKSVDLRLLVSDGMCRSDNYIKALQMQSVRWVGREPCKFLIVRFLVSADKQLFDRWKRFISARPYNHYPL